VGILPYDAWRAVRRGSFLSAPQGRLTPIPEVEQHLQQICVVYHLITVHIHTTQVAACVAKRKQHRQQIGIIDAAVGIHIPIMGNAGGREPEAACEAKRAACKHIAGIGLPDSATQIEGAACGEGDRRRRRSSTSSGRSRRPIGRVRLPRAASLLRVSSVSVAIFA
jgi:hypothetical protein